MVTSQNLGLPIDGPQGVDQGSDRRVNRGSDRRVDRGLTGDHGGLKKDRIVWPMRAAWLRQGSEHFSAHSNCNTIGRWFKSGARNHLQANHRSVAFRFEIRA